MTTGPKKELSETVLPASRPKRAQSREPTKAGGAVGDAFRILRWFERATSGGLRDDLPKKPEAVRHEIATDIDELLELIRVNYPVELDRLQEEIERGERWRANAAKTYAQAIRRHKKSRNAERLAMTEAALRDLEENPHRHGPPLTPEESEKIEREILDSTGEVVDLSPNVAPAPFPERMQLALTAIKHLQRALAACERGDAWSAAAETREASSATHDLFLATDVAPLAIKSARQAIGHQKSEGTKRRKRSPRMQEIERLAQDARAKAHSLPNKQEIAHAVNDALKDDWKVDEVGSMVRILNRLGAWEDPQ